MFFVMPYRIFYYTNNVSSVNQIKFQLNNFLDLKYKQQQLSIVVNIIINLNTFNLKLSFYKI